jgi:hypothetical protein
MGKQTQNKRANGTFAPGNKLGNRFKPGESGNPQGRPKITLLSEALRAQLSEVMPNERTVAERIAAALIAEAARGNVQAIREIGDRTEGKARQSVDVDMNVSDWRQVASAHGISEQDVINEAQRLIESVTDSSGE